VSDYKPKPIGVLTKHVWLINRMEAVSAAINRYSAAGEEVPDAWVSEMTWLQVQISAAKREKEQAGGDR